MTDQTSTPEPAPVIADEAPPTFAEATRLARDTLNEARTSCGAVAAPQLVAVADSYLMLAQILDRRDRALE